MKTYIVGGAVRDRLLGLPVRDRDWVVTGETPESMRRRGFRPVGRDFPVFLHPDTHEEYALARTERKTARGYHGLSFHAAPDVTLEADLARRDLTINAMAEDENGELVDPFNGRQDLAAGILRHVGEAFVEDPVRILRIARFAARFGFSVAEDTQNLMRFMVDDGEVDHLVPERVWQELSKGLMEAQPSRFFTVLRDCGALARILPEVDALWGVPQRADYHPEVDTGVHAMLVLDQSARDGLGLAARFAALCHDLGKALTPAELLPRHSGHEGRGEAPTRALCERLRVPAECRDLALLTVRFHSHIHRIRELRPDTVLRLLRECDALRRPARFDDLLAVCRCDAHGRPGHEQDAYPQIAIARRYLDAAQSVNAGDIARQTPDKSTIPYRIDAARLCAIEAAKRQIS